MTSTISSCGEFSREAEKGDQIFDLALFL